MSEQFNQKNIQPVAKPASEHAEDPSVHSADSSQHHTHQGSPSTDTPINEKHRSSADRLLANLKAHAGMADLGLPPDAPLEDLLAALRDPAWAKRAAAARRLGRMQTPEALEPLLALLTSDPQAAARAAAARALGEMRALSAEKVLTDILHHPDADVRIAAAQGLGAMGQDLLDESIQRLIECFFSEDE